MKTTKLFANGRSQAVRLPQEFRFEGSEVRIRRLGLGVILEPATVTLETWLDASGRRNIHATPIGRYGWVAERTSGGD
jgi:antitoxin VapB